jgi:hypothetical protein
MPEDLNLQHDYLSYSPFFHLKMETDQFFLNVMFFIEKAVGKVLQPSNSKHKMASPEFITSGV